MPFGEGIDDPLKVYEAVLSGHIRYPPNIKGKHPARGIIETMVNRNPAARGTATTLMKSKWFSEFNWDALINRSITPKYKPKVARVNTNKPMK